MFPVFGAYPLTDHAAEKAVMDRGIDKCWEITCMLVMKGEAALGMKKEPLAIDGMGGAGQETGRAGIAAFHHHR
jgi:hypothetical protein